MDNPTKVIMMKNTRMFVLLVACMLTTVIMGTQIADSSIYKDEGITVSVLVDFGDGIVYWADVEITNNTGFNATEKACEKLDLTLGVSWDWGSAYIYQIGDKAPIYPEYWHFLLWNTSTQNWDYAPVGPQDHTVQDNDVIGWYCVVDKPGWNWVPADWLGPRPLPTPASKYPWVSFRHDIYHTGSSGINISGNDVLWSYPTESWGISSTPAIADGKVFATAWNGLYCINENNGSLIWENTNVKGQSSPALYNDHVIVGSTDGNLYCLEMVNGSELWNKTIAPNPGFTGISSSPVVHDDKIFIGTFDNTGGTGYLYCLNENDGEIIWENSTESSIYFSSPSISDGKVFIGTMGLYNSTDYSWSQPYGLYCFNEADGELLWDYPVDNSIGSSPTLFDDKVFFTCKNGGLYCLNENGEFVWEKNIGISVSSPSIYNEKIFVGAGAFGGTGKFYCFDINGKKLWEYETNGPVQSSPAIANSKIYFSTNTDNGTIYCLDENGNLSWKYTPTPNQYILSSPSITDGKMFIGSDNGRLYCFGNKDPVANFTYTPVSPKTNEEITFNASLSSDIVGNIVNYTWDFGDDTIGYGEIVTHKYDYAGEYTTTLTVTDDEGINDTYTVNIMVANSPPTVSISSPSEWGKVKGTVTITGASYDNDGSIEKVEIKIDDKGWVEVNGTSSWSYPWDTKKVSNGYHTISVRAYDGTDYSDVQSITVNVNNEKEKGFIPGFEITILLAGISVALLWAKKKRRR